MFKHYFELIDGVEIYPLFSLIVFVIFFVLVTINALRTDREFIEEMEKLPLDKEEIK